MLKVINGEIRLIKDGKIAVTSWKYKIGGYFQWAVQCNDKSLYEQALLLGQDFNFCGAVHFTNEKECIAFMKEFDKVVNAC